MYLHPTLEDYFKPDPANHGSYFFGWTSTDETYWKENYRIWMAAVREFERSAEMMEKLNEARNPAQLLMTGSRHINLLSRVRRDRAQEISGIARDAFGELSLEASMALHWAAAAGLSTDSPSLILEAVESLTAHPSLAFAVKLLLGMSVLTAALTLIGPRRRRVILAVLAIISIQAPLTNALRMAGVL